MKHMRQMAMIHTTSHLFTDDPATHRAHAESFEAGFRKARAMAIKVVDSASLDPAGRIEKEIASLGEGEAP